MYPNFFNDRISAGYSAEADLKAAHVADIIIKIITKTNKILKISKISLSVKNKVEHFSLYIKKRQVIVGVAGIVIFLSVILSPTTETAQRGFVPQPTTTSVVVVDQSIKWNEAQTLGIDEVHVVKTTKSREVIEVKSRDYPAPSGRSNLNPPRTSGTPRYKSSHVNLYRSPPSINTKNPGGGENRGNSGDPDDSGNPYDSSKTVETGKKPKKEIVSYEFATTANFKPTLN
jgi:hypothetical protein